jgi:hypothetical protein
MEPLSIPGANDRIMDGLQSSSRRVPQSSRPRMSDPCSRRRDGAIRRDRHVNGDPASSRLPLRALPSLFKLIRGIVREIDSPRPNCAQNMKKHAQTIEISR